MGRSTQFFRLVAMIFVVSSCGFGQFQLENSNRLEENTENTTTPATKPLLGETQIVPERDAKIGDLPLSLLDWETPQFLLEHYPFYISGFDDEDRPIWVVELGKYDIRALVEAGPVATQLFDKFTAQTALRMIKSHKIRNPDGNDLSYIVDFEGLSFHQLASLPTVGYIIKLARSYAKLLEDHTNVAIIVNANYVTEILLNFVRPILGGVFANIEVYGTNKERWMPRLLELFPKNQLPEWYGGVKDFVPYKVYG